MAENLAIDGRYSVRGPMQWSGEPHGGFTTADETVRPIVEDGPFGFREVNVARQRRDPDALLNWMERLIRRRRECPELGWGDWSLLPAGDSAVFAHRADSDRSTVVAVHNLGGRDASAQLELGEDGILTDLFAEEEHQLEGGAVSLALHPYDARWFRLRRPGERLPP